MELELKLELAEICCRNWELIKFWLGASSLGIDFGELEQETGEPLFKTRSGVLNGFDIGMGVHIGRE